MASLAKFHYTDQTFHLKLNRHRSSQPKSNSYRIPQKPPLSRAIKASSSSSSSPSTNPKPSFLKTTCVTLTTAAALFSASLHLTTKPAAAILPPPPPPTLSTAADLENSGEIEAETLEKHLASHPNDVEALKSLMKLRFKSKNLDGALEILNQLIEINPEEELEYQILKAQAQTYTGDIESSTKTFEEILIKDPFRVEAYHGLIMAYSDLEDDSKLTNLEARINEAIEKCEKKENVRDFKLLIAQIKVIEGNPNEAIRVYQELVKDEPQDFRPYLCQGLIYTLMKNEDEAEKQFEEFRRLVPENHPYKEYFDGNMLNTNKLNG